MRWGDAVIVWNFHTEAVLAFNVNEAILGEETYAVTTSKNTAPVLRNTFCIEPVAETGCPTIRYGDKVRFVTYINNTKVRNDNNSAPPPKHRSLAHAQFKIQSPTISLNNNPTQFEQHLGIRTRQSQVQV